MSQTPLAAQTLASSGPRTSRRAASPQCDTLPREPWMARACRRRRSPPRPSRARAHGLRDVRLRRSATRCRANLGWRERVADAARRPDPRKLGPRTSRRAASPQCDTLPREPWMARACRRRRSPPRPSQARAHGLRDVRLRRSATRCRANLGWRERVADAARRPDPRKLGPTDFATCGFAAVRHAAACAVDIGRRLSLPLGRVGGRHSTGRERDRCSAWPDSTGVPRSPWSWWQ